MLNRRRLAARGVATNPIRILLNCRFIFPEDRRILFFGTLCDGWILCLNPLLDGSIILLNRLLLGTLRCHTP